MEDDEGWGVVGMSIQSSCGLSDKEEAVRLLVGRWGVAAGPRKGRDRAGWSPLHLAALVSTPQIVSVLLNRGASPSAITHTGLSAYDLITGMEGRESLALLLDPLHAPIPAADDVPKTPQGAHIVSQERRQLLQRRRIRIATRTVREAERAARARVAAERERWVRDRARHIGVNPSVLFRRHQVAAKSNGKLDAGDEDKDADEDEDEDGDGDGPHDEDVDMAVSFLLAMQLTSFRTSTGPCSSSRCTSFQVCSTFSSPNTRPCASPATAVHSPPTPCTGTHGSHTTSVTRCGSRSCLKVPLSGSSEGSM